MARVRSVTYARSLLYGIVASNDLDYFSRYHVTTTLDFALDVGEWRVNARERFQIVGVRAARCVCAPFWAEVPSLCLVLEDATR